jgi:peroxiredoxin
MSSPNQILRPRATAILAASWALLVAGAATAAAAALTSAPAPDFTLHSVAGSNLRLQEQRGQVVMLNFWASWCAPCRQEMPQLDRLYEKYHAAGFQLLGVNVDEDVRNAAGVSSKLGLHFPVLLDTEKRVSHLYDLSTMPSTVLIDRDGRVRYIHRGYKDGYEQTYDEQIRELLRE